MSILDSIKSCTFSDTELTLLKDGAPLANVEVTRSVEWKKLEVDKFLTDERGRVSLPAKSEISARRIMPMEFVSFQQIEVLVDGELIEIWNYSKRKPDLNSEAGGEPLRLTCDLSAESVTQRVFGSAVTTMCTWK